MKNEKIDYLSKELQDIKDINTKLIKISESMGKELNEKLFFENIKEYNNLSYKLEAKEKYILDKKKKNKIIK